MSRGRTKEGIEQPPFDYSEGWIELLTVPPYVRILLVTEYYPYRVLRMNQITPPLALIIKPRVCYMASKLCEAFLSSHTHQNNRIDAPDLRSRFTI